MSDEPTFEQAREELEQIVHRLEDGSTSLDEALALWERGEVLADVCQRWLDLASTRLDEAIAAREGDQADS